MAIIGKLTLFLVLAYASAENATDLPKLEVKTPGTPPGIPPPLQCGQSRPYGVQKRVVSGTTALAGAWPWQALVLFGYRRSLRFVCSGALIHPSWVLTAAHCISHQQSMYKVRLGEFDRTRNEGREQLIDVDKIYVHPYHDYPTLRNNDLALIKLKKPATLNRWVNTVCLPTEDDYLHGGLNCYATGWGLGGRDRFYSNKLQQAHIPLVTKLKCRKRANRLRSSSLFPSRTYITHQMLCGGDDATGASMCMGDSGGPYVCASPTGSWVLQGITSWGSRKCLIKDRYSVFTKVRVFTSWIEEIMNGTTTTGPDSTANEDEGWSHILKIIWSFLSSKLDRSKGT